MQKWLIYSTVSMLIWAGWSLLSPIASSELPGATVQILSSVGLAPVALWLLFSKNLRRGAHLGKGIVLAVMTGFLAGAGNIMVYSALDHGGPVSMVFPISSLAPVVPIVLAPVLFRERIRGVQWFGIAVALAAIVLLNTTAGSPATVQSLSLFSTWMVYALLSLVIFGITYLPQKGATYFISDELSTVAFAVGFVLLDIVLLLVDQSLTWSIPVKAGAVSIAIGVLMGVGSLTLFMAYRHGKASIVTPYVQLFPVISVLAAIPLYNERLDLWRGIGVVAAIGAGVVLSLEQQEPAPATEAPQVSNASVGPFES
jgi:drug/metabolite transporter (DMT)-like permease